MTRSKALALAPLLIALAEAGTAGGAPVSVKRRARQPLAGLLTARPRTVLGVPEWLRPTAVQHSEGWWHVSGGAEPGALVYTGVLALGLEVRFGATGWSPSNPLLATWLSGASLGASAFAVQGLNVSPTSVGDIGIVSNIAGRPALRLFEAWYHQTLLGDRLDLELGFLSIDETFMVLDAALLFINSGFGTPQTLALNTPAPIYPLSAAGAFAIARPAPGWDLRLGVYDGDAGSEQQRDIEVGTQQGAIVLGELAWKASSTSRRLRYSLGGFAHSGAVGLEGRRGVGSVYSAVEFDLWPGSPGAVRTFARVAGAFPARNVTTDLYADAGVVVRGGFWGRGDDSLAIGVAYTGFSATQLSITTSPFPGVDRVTAEEGVVEVTYDLAALPWIHLQPSVQSIATPHFGRDDAWLLGLRASLSF